MTKYFIREEENPNQDLFYSTRNGTMFENDWYGENVIIDGNKHFQSLKTRPYKSIMELDNNFYEKDRFDSIKDFIRCYLPKEKGSYTQEEITRWKELLKTYEDGNIYDILLDALELMTGLKWETRYIRGCVQGDWQEIIYSEKISLEDVKYIECCYFDTGCGYNVYLDKDCKEEYGYVYCPSEKYLPRILGCSKEEIEVKGY